MDKMGKGGDGMGKAKGIRERKADGTGDGGKET